MMPLRISNSDTKTFVCERKFYYAYGMGITSKSQNVSMSKGTFGHTLLENWYKHQSISQLQECYTKLSTQAESQLNTEFTSKGMAKIYYLVLQYIGYYYNNDPANIPKIHYIEQEFELELEPYIGKPMTFVFKPDIIFEENGKLVVMDHKFVYDFYKPNTIELDTQLPKYIAALTLLDKDIQYGILNELRTREVNTGKFQREIITPTHDQFKTIWKDHIRIASKIETWFNKTPKEQAESERIYTPMICKYCNYNDLCVAELKGYNRLAEEIIRTTMEPYEYGQKNIAYLRNKQENNDSRHNEHESRSTP